MRFEEIVKQISEEFTKAWNDGDVDRLMNYLTNNVRLTSPMVSRVYPEHEGNTIEGRDNVKNYWHQLALLHGQFKVTMTSITKSDNKVTTMNHVEGSNLIIKETYTMNEYGKINEVIYEYSEAFPNNL